MNARDEEPQFTAFNGDKMLSAGPMRTVGIAVKRAIARKAAGPVLVYDDATGRAVDLDIRGSDAEFLARLASGDFASPRGPGRPKLGVTAREVTLLPRHWDWLNAQPGGASVTLRKLVEEARKANAGKERKREAQNAAYHFMSAMAGNLPGYEEALRALFADDRERFVSLIAGWPKDIRNHTTQLAYPD